MKSFTTYSKSYSVMFDAIFSKNRNVLILMEAPK